MFHLKVGDAAPEFVGVDQNGEKIALKDFSGKKLIMFFYPKDNTPGCTAEACNLSENYDELISKGFSVLGVSMDSVERHKKFINKYGFPFPLLADTEREVLNLYGVWGLKKFLGKEYDGIHRTTFVISEDGKIENIILKVKTKHHTAQILELY